MLAFKTSPYKHIKYVLPLGFTLIITMMIITSIIAATQIKNNSDLMLNSLKQYYLQNKLLNDMSYAAISRSAILLQIIENDSLFDIDELSGDFSNFYELFINARQELLNQDLSPQLNDLLEQQGKISQINGPIQYEIYQLLASGEKKKATRIFSQTSMPKQRQVLSLINQMANHHFKAGQLAFADLRKKKYIVLTTVFIIDAISILISILLTLYIIQRQLNNDRKLNTLANTDTLTKLPNRANFLSNINAYLNNKPDTIFALVFIDIDYFKSINDNFGHEVGDEILKRISAKIRSYIDDDVDCLSRFGGDEFVLLLRSIKTKHAAIRVIGRLSKDLETSFSIKGNDVFVSASIGASVYPFDGNDVTTLLTNADVAMYSAKELGRNCYQFFSKETSEKMEREHEICHSLHSILKKENRDGELYLEYQPLINMHDGSFSECEALIRWETPDGKTISADDYIPLAEKTNLIEKVNLFVINEACKQQHKWQKQGINNIRININLAGNKMIFSKVLAQFKRNLTEYKLEPACFGIELTERTIHEISAKTINELEHIRNRGMKVSIDDFGTGYSSLSYLKKLPITTLKIDKEFINGLPDDKEDQALVKAIITIGHSLNLDIVAEGVEHAEQFKFLKEHSCNIVQGYYLQKPLNCHDITKLQQVA